MKWLIVPALALLACSPMLPEVAATTPRSISMSRVLDVNFAQATDMAQAHCDAFGLHAEYIPDDRPDGNASYRCVD